MQLSSTTSAVRSLKLTPNPSVAKSSPSKTSELSSSSSSSSAPSNNGSSLLVDRPHISPVIESPTCQDLANEFSKRSWNNSLYTTSFPRPIPGYVANGDSIEEKQKCLEEDKARLLKIVQRHNDQFQQHLPKDSHVVGFVDRLDLQDGTLVNVTTDLHSDTRKLLQMLHMASLHEHIDKSYHTAQKRAFLFLGDYTGRGLNDCLLLSLLLKFRMENPETVIVLRGNHEHYIMLADVLRDQDWFHNHRDLFEACFATFPIAVCVAEEAGASKNGIMRREFVQYSHGLFELCDVTPLIEGKNNRLFILEKKECPQRIISLADANTNQSQQAKKIVAAFKEISHMIEGMKSKRSSDGCNAIDGQTTQAQGYLWGEIANKLSLTRFGVGLGLPIELIIAYAKCHATPKAALKAFVNGHGHTFQEYCSKTDRVMLTTLPISIASGIGSILRNEAAQNPSDLFALEQMQVAIFEIHPKVRNWKKTSVVAQGQGSSFSLVPMDGVPMYNLISDYPSSPDSDDDDNSLDDKK